MNTVNIDLIVQAEIFMQRCHCSKTSAGLLCSLCRTISKLSIPSKEVLSIRENPSLSGNHVLIDGPLTRMILSFLSLDARSLIRITSTLRMLAQKPSSSVNVSAHGHHVARRCPRNHRGYPGQSAKLTKSVDYRFVEKMSTCWRMNQSWDRSIHVWSAGGTSTYIPSASLSIPLKSARLEDYRRSNRPLLRPKIWSVHGSMPLSADQKNLLVSRKDSCTLLLWMHLVESFAGTDIVGLRQSHLAIPK